MDGTGKWWHGYGPTFAKRPISARESLFLRRHRSYHVNPFKTLRRLPYTRLSMNYCSECGAVVTRRWVIEEKRERYICDSCGRTHYQNPRVIVSCIVYCGDQILLCRRGQEPALGQWAIPAGYLECGETLEEGAARETREETGVIVDPEQVELCLVVNMTAIEQIAIAFRIEFKDKPIARPGPECLEVAFMSENEIPPHQFAWQESMGSGPRQFFEELRSRNFSIHLASLGLSPSVGFRLRRYTIASQMGDKRDSKGLSG